MQNNVCGLAPSYRPACVCTHKEERESVFSHSPSCRAAAWGDCVVWKKGEKYKVQLSALRNIYRNAGLASWHLGSQSRGSPRLHIGISWDVSSAHSCCSLQERIRAWAWGRAAWLAGAFFLLNFIVESITERLFFPPMTPLASCPSQAPQVPLMCSQG